MIVPQARNCFLKVFITVSGTAVKESVTDIFDEF